MSVSAASIQNNQNLDHHKMANAIRALAMDAVEQAKSGHPGMPMGMADVATVLFSQFLKFDAANPTWPDRDRFILSAGHGSMLQYALAYLTGNAKITLDQIKNFRQIGALTAGHPEVDFEAGIETTTGPLGQGISNSVGFALAERILNARFGDDLVDHNTYVIASDGDLMEGISHEACALAGHLKLSRLIVLYDDNGITIDGSTDLSYSEDVTKRFEAYGWDVQSIDGHDPAQISSAIAAALTTDTPSIIRCKTKIGFGAPTKEGKSSSHGAPLGADEIKGARENLGWSYGTFEIPDDVLDAWRSVGSKGAELSKAWTERLSASSQKSTFESQINPDIQNEIKALTNKVKAKFQAEKPVIATRKASGLVLETLVPGLPQLVGGSADLTGSNLTKTGSVGIVSAKNYDGQYIYFGVREHGMAAAMNGMALHGGIIPFGGTFLSFADYCRPSIRLSALMKQRVVYVMTHDSIGLGEDGPTHQPVEHVASLRAIPNLNVFRPADPIETAEAWQIALESEGTPSVLALTRQNLAFLRDEEGAENKSARGAYILKDSVGAPDVVILASGSEVEIAVEAAEKLEQSGKAVRVVSVPCLDLFEQQDPAYQTDILGPETAQRVAIEAGIRQSWDRWLGPKGIFVGMSSFGESGPYKELYAHFGITAEAVVDHVQNAHKSI